jgi:hypothetical protein
MIPLQTTYDNLKPYGYKSNVKTVKFQPISGNIIVPNDIVRFQINTKGYWDPTTCYINLTVQLDDSYLFGDAIQIDGSASSFIAEFQASSNGTVFENIREYDQMANFLEDINYSNEQRFTKTMMGMGNNSRANTKSIGGAPNAFTTRKIDTTAPNLNLAETYYSGFRPWFVYPYDRDGTSGVVVNSSSVYEALYYNDGLASTQPFYPQDADNQGTSILMSQMINAYNIPIYKNLYGLDTNGGLFYHNNCGPSTTKTQFGLGMPYGVNNDLSQGCFEPALVKGVGLQDMYDGCIRTRCQEKRDFVIPFYSGVFGALMPKDSIKYIPMSTLQDLILEFRINPYAVFTSGYAQLTKSGTYETVYNTNPTTHNLLQRKFKITNFEIVVDLIYFDEQLENLTKAQFNSLDGIVFHTISWHNISSFVIPAGQTPSGNYTIQKNYDSLKALVITFLPNDYLIYPWLRKLYRINNSVVSLQLSINHEFFPPYPLRGHSGTSNGYDLIYANQNNNDYLINLYKCFDKFNNYNEDCSINSVNFAVGSRYFSQQLTNNYLNVNPTPTVYANISNINGPLLMLQENLVKGKALFAIDLQTLGDDKRVISGLNTKQTTIDIIIGSDSSNPYRRGYATNSQATHSTTMYVWCLYDVVINIQKNKVQSVGIN